MTRKGKRGVTHPFIMQRGKETKKVAQSYLITLDLFTTFMYVPTPAQIEKKPAVCSLTIATKTGSTSVLSSRYLNIKALNAYLEKAEKHAK